MKEYLSITKYDIEKKLSNELLRISRIISSAMVVGPTLFLFFIIFLYLKSDSLAGDEYNALDINIFSTIVLVIAILNYTAFFIFPIFYLKPKNVLNRLSQIADQSRNKIDDPVIKLILFDRIYMIIRLAILEGVALFGMVILFQAVSGGQINENPNLWLWIIPIIVLGIFVLNNYISKDKYIERIENQFLSKLKQSQS